MRNDGEDLGVSVLEEIENTLDGKESVGVLLLTDALHEDGEVMMVVKFVHLNLPCNLVWRSMLNLNGQVSTIIEAAELRRCNLSSFDSASFGSKHSRLSYSFV